MIQQIYSIYDVKAEVFHLPFYNKTHGEAERNFLQLTKDEKSMIAKYPEDFSLYHMGTYDDSTGLIQSLKEPMLIVSATTIASKRNIPDQVLS